MSCADGFRFYIENINFIRKWLEGARRNSGNKQCTVILHPLVLCRAACHVEYYGLACLIVDKFEVFPLQLQQ